MDMLTRTYSSVENGGIMFGRMHPLWVEIYDVSDAGPNANRTKYGVTFDNEYIRDYSLHNEKQDYFFLGTWHSHPPNYNIYPSMMDISTMKKLNEGFDPNYYPIFCITKVENGVFYFKFYELSQEKEVVSKDCVVVGG